MRGILKITLKSDLCAASGDGFSSAIDTDVAYDKFGLPIIPGRRLKGAFRKVGAEILGFSDEKLNGIFGVTGSDMSGSLHISNAFIKDYKATVEYLKTANKEPQEVLSLFTYTRAQTAMEHGVAKEGSLRFTRVVSHYLNNEETAFFADVSIDEEYEEDYIKLCKGLRNLGFNKNRGFGAIKCELLKNEKDLSLEKNFDFQNDKEYKIHYTVNLKTPVMVPSSSSDNSQDYISGTSVMGYFAGKLIKTQEKDEFDKIFLQNNVKFSNLYPVTPTGEKCIPAPKIIGKDKLAARKEEEYCNILDAASKNKVIKPLKNGFVNEHFLPYAVDSEIIFHNSHLNEQKLYTQKCLSANQKFYGTIEGNGEFLKEIFEKMQEGEMSLGRSKTAQYSVCEILDLAVTEAVAETLEVENPQILVYILQSDAIITNDWGTAFADIDDLKKALSVNGEALKETSVSYTTVTGYNGKWNQKKPHLRAFSKGSALVFEAEKGNYPKVKYIGEKQGEGYGKAVLYKPSEIKPNFTEESNKKVALDNSNILEMLLEANSKREKIQEKALNYVLDKNFKQRLLKDKNNLNTSFIGRVLNMIEQSKDIEDLKTRMLSIKTMKKQKFALITLESADYNNSVDNLQYMNNLYTYMRYIVKQGGVR